MMVDLPFAYQCGAVVPDAVVKTVNKGTGLTRELKSGESGTFRLDLLPAGTHELTVTKPRFATPRTRTSWFR
jgi:hypothetical protein